jgi:hypothetical protein
MFEPWGMNLFVLFWFVYLYAKLGISQYGTEAMLNSQIKDNSRSSPYHIYRYLSGDFLLIEVKVRLYEYREKD